MDHEREYKLEHDKIMEYMVQNIVTTKALVNSLEYTLLAYIGKKSPELLDVVCDQLQDLKQKSFQKSLDDLSLLDEDLSNALRKELDDLNSSK